MYDIWVMGAEYSARVKVGYTLAELRSTEEDLKRLRYRYTVRGLYRISEMRRAWRCVP